jgi:hypothetical protein
MIGDLKEDLNACNFIMVRYPRKLKEAIYFYGINLITQRKALPYFRKIFTVFRLASAVKWLGEILIYVLSLSYIRV